MKEHIYLFVFSIQGIGNNIRQPAETWFVARQRLIAKHNLTTELITLVYDGYKAHLKSKR